MPQALHQPGPQQWTWGGHTILRGAQASGHPASSLTRASDVLTFQVQEAMFLEEPPATVGLRSPVIPQEKNKGQEGCAPVCTCLLPQASPTPHISRMCTYTLHAQTHTHTFVDLHAHVPTYVRHLTYISYHILTLRCTYRAHTHLTPT